MTKPENTHTNEVPLLLVDEHPRTVKFHSRMVLHLLTFYFILFFELIFGLSNNGVSLWLLLEIRVIPSSA